MRCSTTFALSYGLSFAAITALIVYTYLHHSKAIWDQYRNSTSEKPDSTYNYIEHLSDHHFGIHLADSSQHLTICIAIANLEHCSTYEAYAEVQGSALVVVFFPVRDCLFSQTQITYGFHC